MSAREDMMGESESSRTAATDAGAPSDRQHTIGPWTFDVSGGDYTVFVVDDLPGLLVIAELADQPEAEANARLIAAAPDLLLACKMALNDRMFKEWPAIATALQAAIAKADGHFFQSPQK